MLGILNLHGGFGLKFQALGVKGSGVGMFGSSGI